MVSGQCQCYFFYLLIVRDISHVCCFNVSDFILFKNFVNFFPASFFFRFPPTEVILKNVLFEKNSAAQQGGGLVATDTFQYGTTVTMDRNTRFVDNVAIVGNKDALIIKAGFTFLDCQPGYFATSNLGSLNENFNSDGKGCLSPCLPGHFGQGVATREEKESCPA